MKEHRLDCKCEWEGGNVVSFCGAHWGYVHKNIYKTDKHGITTGKGCTCQWDGSRVLSLCKSHHEYVQKEYVQVTGTLIRVDDDGEMIDYKRIPDQNRKITQVDIRRVVNALQHDTEELLAGDNPYNKIARAAVNCIIIALRKELL